MTTSGESLPFTPADMPRFKPERVETTLGAAAVTDSRAVTQPLQEQLVPTTPTERARPGLLSEAEARLLKQVRRALGGGNPDMAGRKPVRYRRPHFK
jgi:hypothetical protein